MLRNRLTTVLKSPQSLASIRSRSALTSFATVDLDAFNGKVPHKVLNLVGGQWEEGGAYEVFPDPLNGEPFLQVRDTKSDEIRPFIESLLKCPKHGLHNPFKNPERYLMYGEVCAKAAARLKEPECMDFFTRLIQRVAPKSYAQARGEVFVTQKFLENFGGDQVRFLARGFTVPGDYSGQSSGGYRFPYGPTALIAPFNFPIEIPVLQLFGALFMGNKVLLKGDSRVSVVMEQALRLFIDMGMPMSDVDFINTKGPVMHELLLAAQPKMTLFTGSSRVAEVLAKDLHGRLKIEDAGFDWKVLGPDVKEFEYVAWQSDQDAYAFSGQKCSAQSILFVHENWANAGLLDRLKELASRRDLKDLTIGPHITVTNAAYQAHVDALLRIKGSKMLFGGYLQSHTIPAVYGSFTPTTVEVIASSSRVYQ
jgi:1-pyrroline-5-carboxylate dehydrogenase